jgi:hypothetical protein
MGFLSECKPEDKTKEEGTNVDECLYFVREKEQIFCYVAAVILNDGLTGHFIQELLFLYEASRSHVFALMSLDFRIVPESIGAQS